MRLYFTALVTAVAGLSAICSTPSPSWNDAALTKESALQRKTATPTVMTAGGRQISSAPSLVLSETPLKQGKVTPRRMSSARKAVTSADLPAEPVQLTYQSSTFQYVNDAEITLSGDSIYLSNFFGWGTTVKGKVNASDGTFILERQPVYMHPTYGQVDLMACSVAENVFDPNGTIPGTIANGKVEIGEWVALIIDGEYKNSAIGYGLHSNSIFEASNAKMTSTVFETDTAGVASYHTETIRLYVDQPAGNAMQIYNLAASGSRINAYFHSDSTFSIPPQQLFSNSYGAFFCYSADWEKGEVYQIRDLKGTTDGNALLFGNWGIYTNTGKYYYRRYTETRLEIPFAPSFPPHSAGWSGSGTADDPYLITNAADLFALSEAVNSVEIPSGARMAKVFEGVHFKQTALINMKDYRFSPIGGSDDMRRFAGTYDGNNKTISNLTINTGSKGYAALFGAVDTVGTVKNVVLSSPNISSEKYYYTGGVVAYSMGRTENCKVTNGNIRGYLIVGGVAGSSGPADNLTFTGNVEGASNVGGVIGNMRYPVTNCSATNTTVTGYGGSENYSVGGVVGYMTSSSLNVKTGGYIEDSYFSGTVTMNRYLMFAGGIAGCSVEADIRRCFAVCEINTTSSVSQTAAGGIVGAIQGMKLEDCYFAGNMEVPGSWTGPLAGYAINIKMAGHPENSEIKNCYIACHSRSTSNYDYTPYLGWFDTRTAGVAPVITNCRIDASLLPQQNGKPGFTPLADMISGTPWEGFDPSVWKFEKNFYPTLSTIPANTAANIGKAPMIFTGEDNVENVSANFTLPTANSVTWQVRRNGALKKEGYGIIINGTTAQLNGSVATDTIYASNGTTGKIIKWFTVKCAPAGMFDGEGTAEKPYLIKTKEDLMRLAEATTNTQLTFDGSHFLITNDIDLELDPNFPGISNCTSATFKFGGILDGGNHTLHRVRIVIPELDENGKIIGGKTSTRGFIGRLKQGGVVKNLRMGADCQFEFYSTSGAIVGENTGGEIINCRNYATVKAHAGTSGGIVGYNRAPGRVIDCYNSGDVIGGFHYVGGIASYNYGVMEGCQNAGRVSTEIINGNYTTSQLAGAGGLVLANFGQIYNSLNTGTVYSMKYAGGLEGWHNTSETATSMRGCLNLGEVICGEAATIGQITGHQYKVPKVENVYWDAQVSSYPQAGDNGTMPGTTGVTTAFLTQVSDSIDGMDKSKWTFVQGRYPMLTAFADEAMAQAASMAVVDFNASVNHVNIKHDAALAQTEGLSWSLADGSPAFRINGSTLEMYACDEHTDTLIAAMGSFVRRIPLVSTPDSLQAPELIDTLLERNCKYKLIFSHLVEGVKYYYTIDGSAPYPSNSAAIVTDGEDTVDITKDTNLRAVAYHHNYYLSPEITRLLEFMSVGNIEADAVPVSVIYYNAEGIGSHAPWRGLNIVVSIYADGTRSVEKRTMNP